MKMITFAHHCMVRRASILLLMLCLWAMCAAGKTFTLVIDAGHGGHDTGALGKYSKEKNINLKVALAFGKLVEKNCPDVKVIYTRKTDVFIPLYERADMANRNKADLFISIHTNALPKGRIARGMETYTLGMHRAADNLDVAKRENAVILIEEDYKRHYEGFDPNSAESYIMFEYMQDVNMSQSVDLARFVQRRACAAAGRQDKGVKQAGFLVLRETSMPSCLIELGFITTPDEEKFLNTENGVNALSKGIYQAFTDYRRKYDSGAQPLIVENAPEAPAAVEAPLAVTAPVSGTSEAVAAAPSGVTLERPVFKVQIAASATPLKAGSKKLRGVKDAECYRDGGMYKYTCGSSYNYDDINDLKNSLKRIFPDAFVVAFRGGQRMELREAIDEYKRNK